MTNVQSKQKIFLNIQLLWKIDSFIHPLVVDLRIPRQLAHSSSRRIKISIAVGVLANGQNDTHKLPWYVLYQSESKLRLKKSKKSRILQNVKIIFFSLVTKIGRRKHWLLVHIYPCLFFFFELYPNIYPCCLATFSLKLININNQTGSLKSHHYYSFLNFKFK